MAIIETQHSKFLLQEFNKNSGLRSKRVALSLDENGLPTTLLLAGEEQN
jgi:hypothetical protein